MNQRLTTIGPNFGNELQAAGLGGKIITWGADGVWWKDLSPGDEVKLQNVITTHNPNVIPVNPRVKAKSDLQAATSIAQMKAALLELL